MTENQDKQTTGWSWTSFLLGPFFYLANGMASKGLVLLLIALVTFGFGIPIIWVYCGLKGQSDLHEMKLKQKSQYSPDKI